MTSLVRLERAPIDASDEARGVIATLVFDSPKTRNALTAATGRRFAELLDELERDRSVRIVILRGEGAGFSAGGDLEFIEERTRSTNEANRAAMLQFYGMFLGLTRLPVPTIAAIHGKAVGAGVCVALACDIRIASTDAELGLTFVRLGLHPGMGATTLLPAVVGEARAAELLLTGRTISARDAERIGLVNEVTNQADLLARAASVAREIAAAAPVAVKDLVETLRARKTANLAEALEREARAQAGEYATADLLEGVRAIRERRAPRFVGR